MIVEPYLFFEGRCEEALNFYREVLGAEVTYLMRFSESPEPENNPPGTANKIMHATMQIGEHTIMMSDGMCQSPAEFKGFALAINLPEADQVRAVFERLSEKGKPIMALEKTFWSPLFGMVTDQFGVMWMVGILE